eukprot:CAMPEP_0117574226 /NCGR_PEP_ID=MMETSP0784-20121206/61450_1 /TAXON_ID=39447 /ORGANISM="" /LENGTH=55 /DNA_ID=CAMNT_0005372995 /DNA_START=14 /DNA_END=178 /DNA_ORIENTATION=-
MAASATPTMARPVQGAEQGPAMHNNETDQLTGRALQAKLVSRTSCDFEGFEPSPV